MDENFGRLAKYKNSACKYTFVIIETKLARKYVPYEYDMFFVADYKYSWWVIADDVELLDKRLSEEEVINTYTFKGTRKFDTSTLW